MIHLISILFFHISIVKASLPLNEFNSTLLFPVKQEALPFIKSGTSVTQNINNLEFEAIKATFKSIFNQEVKEKTGMDLIIEGRWEQDDLQAYATYNNSDQPVIYISGSFARIPRMDTDTLYLLLCHELGHHLGGAPKKVRGNSSKRSWSSAEGQADYYATMKCLPKVFERFQYFAPKNELILKERCKSNDCERLIFTSLNLASIYSFIKNESAPPKMNIPSPVVVGTTNFDHPDSQCRLDTMIAGSLCEDQRHSELDDINPFHGVCNRQNERNKSRPSCWFSPLKY